MKKIKGKKIILTISVLLIIAAISFIVVYNLKDNLNPKILLGIIGKDKESAFKELKIEEGKEVRLSKEPAGIRYDFKEKKFLYGEKFKLTLLMYKKGMYGFEYSQLYSENPEKGYKIAQSLYKKLSKEYGKETTYPTLKNRITVMPSYDELVNNNENVEYFETWNVKDKISVKLNVHYVPYYGIHVYAQYAIMENPK